MADRTSVIASVGVREKCVDGFYRGLIDKIMLYHEQNYDVSASMFQGCMAYL